MAKPDLAVIIARRYADQRRRKDDSAFVPDRQAADEERRRRIKILEVLPANVWIEVDEFTSDRNRFRSKAFDPFFTAPDKAFRAIVRSLIETDTSGKIEIEHRPIPGPPDRTVLWVRRC